MRDAEEYTISVRVEVIDGEKLYVARVDELPDVEEYADTFEFARELALDSIQTSQAFFHENGMVFPEPKMFISPEVSGRVTLRLPKTVHANCIARADEEGVSLNTYILTCIASYRGELNRPVLATILDSSVVAEYAAKLAHKNVVQRTPNFRLAVETTSSAMFSFSDKHKELPLSCREVAASFNRVKFQNA
ncbi:toxin-antitoxin system HicB family antitoxin [Lelliottia amnigena]|uniref:toxin-antitoxin system HicB family antitoxin n=1 Tax=Lelliottia amnigena TaxID=61646 RepID=UPI0021D9F91A|nr:toxin-antitoxin system HicB family antitoxin [Lelliottia amnigena]MCU7781985.1 toxin-antitoxin system HicB family antitoxin [Lelliottia amnigena]